MRHCVPVSVSSAVGSRVLGRNLHALLGTHAAGTAMLDEMTTNGN